MTYSIITIRKGVLVIGVVSGSIGVGKRVPWAIPGIGGVVTQGYTNPRLGPLVLRFLKRGYSVRKALSEALSFDKNPELRQIGVINWNGDKAYYCGSMLPSEAGVSLSENAIVIGNFLSTRLILEAIIQELHKYKNLPLHFCVLKALEVGHMLGGDKRGDRSASILIVYDKGKVLRVDVYASSNPIKDLHQRLKDMQLL